MIWAYMLLCWRLLTMSEKIARYLDSLKYGWRKIPPSLQIGITDHCFNKCIMCGHWQRPNKSVLAWHDLMSFLAQAKGNGLESVCYSGGDPFTYYAINDVMEWHMNNDIKFGFITGGYVPSSIDMSLLKCAQWVRVSLDAIGCDAYANIRGGVLFSEVDNSIKSMIRYGVNVELGITITDISDICDCYAQFNINTIPNHGLYAIINFTKKNPTTYIGICITTNSIQTNSDPLSTLQ